MDFAAMAQLCAPNIDAATLSGIVAVESGFNPFAIGVVGGQLARQPKSLDEAVATADRLRDLGYNYSVGLAQINQVHFAPFGLSHRTAFEPCTNLSAGAQVLADCYRRATGAVRLGDALSCYNSGNFLTGHSNGYVTKVMTARARLTVGQARVLPVEIIASQRSLKRPIPAAQPETATGGLLTSAALNPPSDATSPATALLF